MDLVKCPMCNNGVYHINATVKLCNYCNGTGKITKKKNKNYNKCYGLKDEKYFKRRELLAKLNVIKRLKNWISYKKFLKETYF